MISSSTLADQIIEKADELTGELENNHALEVINWAIIGLKDLRDGILDDLEREKENTAP